MGYLDRANLEAILLDDAVLKERQISRQPIGSLRHPGGSLVACDPLADPTQPPFADLSIPLGTYAVELLRARNSNALAVLWLKERTRVAAGFDWLPALIGGQDASALTGDRYFGYPVDAGLGCFMSNEARDAMLARCDELGDDGNYYDDVLAGEMDGDWVDHVPAGGVDAPNILVFSAGYGDGSYPTFVGYDGGELAVVVTDFFVMQNGDGRDREELFFLDYSKTVTPERLSALERLGRAASEGDVATLRELLAQGLGANDPIPMRGTAILAAIRKGQVQSLAILVGDGPIPAIPEPLIVSSYGSYLELARKSRRPSADVIALLERGTPKSAPPPMPVASPSASPDSKPAGSWFTRLFRNK